MPSATYIHTPCECMCVCVYTHTYTPKRYTHNIHACIHAQAVASTPKHQHSPRSLNSLHLKKSLQQNQFKILSLWAIILPTNVHSMLHSALVQLWQLITWCKKWWNNPDNLFRVSPEICTLDIWLTETGTSNRHIFIHSSPSIHLPNLPSCTLASLLSRSWATESSPVLQCNIYQMPSLLMLSFTLSRKCNFSDPLHWQSIGKWQYSKQSCMKTWSRSEF